MTKVRPSKGLYVTFALQALMGVVLAIIADKPVIRLVGSVLCLLGVVGLWVVFRGRSQVE